MDEITLLLLLFVIVIYLIKDGEIIKPPVKRDD